MLLSDLSLTPTPIGPMGATPRAGGTSPDLVAVSAAQGANGAVRRFDSRSWPGSMRTIWNCSCGCSNQGLVVAATRRS